MDEMYVGAMKVRMIVRESHSLKDKRQVLNSIKDKLKNNFNVSVAEVDEQENRQMIVLGIGMIGNESQHVRNGLEKIAQALRLHPIAEFVDQTTEIY